MTCLPVSLLANCHVFYVSCNTVYCGPGSSVGIATTGWTVRGSNPGVGEIFRTCPDRPWGPPSLQYNRYRVLPEGKERPTRDADPLPLLVPWSRKSRAIPPTPSMGRTACTESLCLYKGALYLLPTTVYRCATTFLFHVWNFLLILYI